MSVFIKKDLENNLIVKYAGKLDIDSSAEYGMAINDAIDKQAAEDGQEFFTNSRQNLHSGVASAPDFDNLMEEFKTIVANIPGSADPKCETEEGQKFKEYWMPRIIEITDRYLGKGKKVNQCTRDQVEALDLIVTELKDLTHIQ